MAPSKVKPHAKLRSFPETSESYNADYDQPPLESIEIPTDLESAAGDYSISENLSVANSVNEDTDTGSGEVKNIISDRWSEFVDMIADGANKSLVSLLRNAVVLTLTDEKIIIGYQNLDIFTNEKRRTIERYAQQFFNKNISIYYKEDSTGLDISLREKSDLEKEKQIEEKKRIAGQDKKIIHIKQMFPDSEIINITVLKE